MSATGTIEQPKTNVKPQAAKPSPVIDATDRLIAWVESHGTGKRSHGELNSDEFTELSKLDSAFGDAITTNGIPAISLPDQPEKVMVYGEWKPSADALPNCNLKYRWIVGTRPMVRRSPVREIDPENLDKTITKYVEMTVEGTGTASQWWIMDVDEWLKQMRRFKADLVAMK